MKIVKLEQVSSTNNYAKEYVGEEDLIVTAKAQTAGRGTKGRSFISDMGGVYLTKLSKNLSFPASEVFQIMLCSSVAVCRTLEDFGLSPTIKWPNDVYVNGKKICGILIENTFSGSRIASSIVGIGVNVNNSLPDDLAAMATTMSLECNRSFSVDMVRDALIGHLQESYSLEEYKKYISFLGEEVLLLQDGQTKKVTAIEIDSLGRLVVKEGERIYAVTAGEVSFRYCQKEGRE